MEEVYDLAWEYTAGQPWLVNALACEMCFRNKVGKDRTHPITIRHHWKDKMVCGTGWKTEHAKTSNKFPAILPGAQRKLVKSIQIWRGRTSTPPPGISSTNHQRRRRNWQAGFKSTTLNPPTNPQPKKQEPQNPPQRGGAPERGGGGSNTLTPPTQKNPLFFNQISKSK